MSLKMLLKIPGFLITRNKLINRDEDYWRAKLKGKSLQIDGRTLNPKAQVLIDLQSSLAAPVEKWTPAMIRGGYNKSMEFFDGEKMPLSSVEDNTIPLEGRTLRARLYGDYQKGQSKPAMMYFHGGGFVIGGLESHDRLCRKLAIATGQLVIAIDYRLGPESRFPAAFLDAIDSWKWLQENAKDFGVDPKAISVCGDSAGGLLAHLVGAVASKEDIGEKPAALGLIYPVKWGVDDTNSRKVLSKENIVLTQDLLDWFSKNFTSGNDEAFSDLTDAFDNAVAGEMPPAWVLTCGFDPLRDEGEMIAEQLKKLGSSVRHIEYEQLYHGFIGASAIFPEVDKMVDDLSGFVLAQQQNTTALAS